MNRSWSWALALFLVIGPPAAGAGATPDTTQPSSEVDRARRLLSRATYGARAEDLIRAAEIGHEAWLDEQLHPERLSDAGLTARLAPFLAADKSGAELYRAFPPPAQLRRELGIEAPTSRRDVDPAMTPADSIPAVTRAPRDALPPEVRRQLRERSPQRLAGELVAAKLTRAVYSKRQLEEVMTDFWFNHFNVFFGDGPVRWLVADYERHAIRPHVFGRFEEMLVTTARHPAMLLYLDNAMSAAPDTTNPAIARRLRRADRVPGLNENYARELLELHTLGVDGGYTQEDVIEVARAFTGWSVTRPRRADVPDGRESREPFEFVFRPQLHDMGEKTVLGQRLPDGRGIEDGLDVLRMLARHPSTARQVAIKLARAFVDDDPPPALVDELSRVFLDTEGDLRAVTRALFTSESFYDSRYEDAKVKTPFEFVVSALRMTRAEVGPSRGLVQTLRSMGGAPYLEPAPTGYPTTAEAWANSGAMLARMNFALDLVAGRVEGVRFDAGSLHDGSIDPVEGILSALFPGGDTDSLASSIGAEVAGAPPQDVADRALALALGSPDFQKR